MKDRRAALCFELTALLAEGKAPEWVQLLPAGPKVMGRDGRWWLLSDPEGVAAASLSDRDRLPIDWEHSTEKKALYGEPAPAAGWITQMDVREGAIWGKVEWNDRGREMVEAKEYRYLSPVFNYELEGMEIVRLTSAGLTNVPNFDMQALNQLQEVVMEFLKKLATALGLAEASTEEQVLEAVNRQKSDLETARNREETPSLDKFVPRSDYDAAVTRATNAETKLSEHQAQAIGQEIDSEISKALAAGKITPATKDYHAAQCRAEGGLERFKKFLEAAPVIAAPSGITGDPPANPPALNAEQTRINRFFANSEEDLDKHAPVN